MKVETQTEWVCANRHVPELTAEQREQYGLPDNLVLCPAQGRLVRFNEFCEHSPDIWIET
jgi:hypothetical protein